MNSPKTLDPKMLSALFGVKVDKPTGSYGQTTRERLGIDYAEKQG